MARLIPFATALVVAFTLLASAPAQEPAQPKARVEFRWLEAKPVKGLTQEKGIQTTCGDELSYPHLVPALTNKDVALTVLKNHDFSAAGLPGDHFTVTFHLTGPAKQALVAACRDKQGGVLAIYAEGRYWGTANFQKARADDFAPSAGFIPSRAEAERIAAAAP